MNITCGCSGKKLTVDYGFLQDMDAGLLVEVLDFTWTPETRKQSPWLREFYTNSSAFLCVWCPTNSEWRNDFQSCFHHRSSFWSLINRLKSTDPLFMGRDHWKPLRETRHPHRMTVRKSLLGHRTGSEHRNKHWTRREVGLQPPLWGSGSFSVVTLTLCRKTMRAFVRLISEDIWILCCSDETG